MSRPFRLRCDQPYAASPRACSVAWVNAIARSSAPTAIPTISPRMLTLSLRGLERDGPVSHTVTPSIPPRVDYELTRPGHSLRGPVCALSQWAIDKIDAIHGAQGAFDEAGMVARAA